MSNTTITRTLAATAAVVLAATMAAAVPAAGATRTFHDAVGDVAHGVDVRSVKVVNEKNLRVVVRHDDLVRSFRSGASMTVFLDTDRAQSGPEFAFPTALFASGDYALIPTVGEGWAFKPRAVPLTCSYELNIDYARDAARIRISRACVDRPGAVRVAVRAGGEQADGTTVTDWYAGRRELTPWVGRG